MSHAHNEHSVQTQTAPGSASVVQVESSRLLPWLMLACILGGASIVMSWMAYRMASIATMRVEGFTRALIAHGIKNTYPHIPGEDD
jgi:hypothetical protein